LRKFEFRRLPSARAITFPQQRDFTIFFKA
jgi:hypothetical protein